MRTLLWSVIVYLLNTGCLLAQDKIQVVTKTITRSFAFGQEESLRIDAQKATIRIKGWDQEEVKLVLKLTAKHPERAVAERELSALRYQLTTDGSHKLLKNYFQATQQVSAITSNLQADYELRVPHQRAVSLSNHYGNITLSDWQATLNITAEFGEVHLEQITGAIALDVTYADVTARHTRGSLTGVTRKSNLNLYELAGTVSLESSYGEINVTALDQLQQLTIDASRTEVTFATPDPIRYYYRLSTTNDNIYVPVPGTWADENSIVRKQSFTTSDPSLPSIFVKTTFSPITINFLNHETPLRTHRP